MTFRLFVTSETPAISKHDFVFRLLQI